MFTRRMVFYLVDDDSNPYPLNVYRHRRLVALSSVLSFIKCSCVGKRIVNRENEFKRVYILKRAII